MSLLFAFLNLKYFEISDILVFTLSQRRSILSYEMVMTEPIYININMNKNICPFSSPKNDQLITISLQSEAFYVGTIFI